jgi:chaperonin GroES
MNLKPLSDCILIKQAVEKQGLIVLVQTKMAQGHVVAAGPKVEDLKVGDYVLFGEHSGQKVKHEGDEYLMMREADVIGVLNE